jgi:hypothetical protein
MFLLWVPDTSVEEAVGGGDFSSLLADASTAANPMRAKWVGYRAIPFLTSQSFMATEVQALMSPERFAPTYAYVSVGAATVEATGSIGVFSEFIKTRISLLQAFGLTAVVLPLCPYQLSEVELFSEALRQTVDRSKARMPAVVWPKIRVGRKLPWGEVKRIAKQSVRWAH